MTADEGGNENHPDNKKFSGEGWTELSQRKRGCTDCLCVLLIGAAWFAMTVIGFIVCGVVKDSHLSPGNPNRLTHAIDYDGRICGIDSGVRSRPNAYYMTSGAVVCVKHCPSTVDYSEFICFDEVQDDADGSELEAWKLVAKQKCLFKAKTREFLYRCMVMPPDTNITAADVASEFISTTGVSFDYNEDSTSWAQDFFASLWELRGYIFGFGVGVALGVAFLYLYVLQIPGLLALVIWGILLGILLFMCIGSFLLWDLANKWSDDDNKTDDEKRMMYVFSYIGMAITGLYICLLLVMRKRINLAIGIVKEAARGMAAMPILLFTPIFQAVGIVVFLVPWTIYVLYLASSGEVKTYSTTIDSTVTQYHQFEYTKNARYAFLYLLFCWFWTSEFIVAIGQIAVAGAFAGWYFTREKSMAMNAKVFWGYRIAVFCHMGTAAFGSLVIAIIKTISAVLTYLQKKAKKSGNRILVFILAVLKCCLWCLEKCMKFLNKNAYIQTAIHGYSFCKAARVAFFLLLRNVLRVLGVSIVGDFVLILGKVLVPLATVFLCYLALAYGYDENNLPSIIAPLILVFILSYFISCMFSEIFGMGITTIMHCFIADEEMFPPEQRFADGALRSTWQKTVQAATSDGKVAPAEESAAEGGHKEKDGVLL